MIPTDCKITNFSLYLYCTGKHELKLSYSALICLLHIHLLAKCITQQLANITSYEWSANWVAYFPLGAYHRDEHARVEFNAPPVAFVLLESYNYYLPF